MFVRTASPLSYGLAPRSNGAFLFPPAVACVRVACVPATSVFVVLQVMDAFCTSRANLSGPKVESVLAWALHLRRLGGVEHLVAALKVCLLPPTRARMYVFSFPYSSIN